MTAGFNSRATRRIWLTSDKSNAFRSSAITRLNPAMCASVQSRLDRWGLSTRSFVQKSWTGLRVGQPFPGCILVGEQRRANERPFNADFRVIPQNTALVFGKPIIGRFV